MDDVKGPPRLLLLVSKIEKPLIPTHDLPVPFNELDRDAIEIESNAILANDWILPGPADGNEAYRR